MPESGWPPHVRTVNFEDIGRLGVSEENGKTLYWDGKPVEVRKKISLTWRQGIIALMAALGSVASGVVAILEYMKG